MNYGPKVGAGDGETRVVNTAAMEARIAELEEALREIGAYGDLRAEDHLGRTGSYSMFDEPAAVERARQALTGKRHDTDR